MQENFRKSDHVILFNHVPKAGGTSLIHFFTEIFGAERVFRHKARDSRTDTYSPGIETLSRDELSKYRFFAGHFEYGHHRLFDCPVRYLGVVREPMERAFSHYHFLRKHGPRNLREQALSMSFEEYLAFRLRLKDNPMVSSAQIRILTGQSDLEQAKKIVAREYIGCCTIAQLDDMQRSLARYYGRPDLSPRNVNKTTKDSGGMMQISPDLMKELDQRFALDREFIDWVGKKFRSTFSKLAA